MKNILCFGDSNTYGLVPGTMNERYGWNVRWTSIVDEKLRDRGYRVIEEGLCGRTTIFEDELRDNRRGVDMLPALLETHNLIDIVILMLGTNDCKTAYSSSPELIGKGIEKLLGQISMYAPHSKILLMSPIFLGERIWEDGFDGEFDKHSIEISKKLPHVYEKLARRKEIYYLKASDYAQPSSIDMEHLDEEQHQKLALAVVDYLEQMIGKSLVA